MLRPFKFIVQAVVLEENEEGRILGERQGDVLTVYGADALEEWARGFVNSLEDAEIRRPGDSTTDTRSQHE